MSGVESIQQDNRTYQTDQPIPRQIRTIEQVNLSNLTPAIVACCRNVQRYLLGFQRNVRAVGKLFRFYRLYLAESDSNDGTLEFLQEWQEKDSAHVSLHTSGQHRWQLFFRAQRLAYCRNHLLNQVRQDMPSFDYFFVVDVDKTSGQPFSVARFLTNFIYPRSS